MKTILFVTMAAVALIAAGCSNDEGEPADNWNGEIRLSSGIEVQTRATHNLDVALKAGEKVHVWVDDAGNSSSLYENNEMTVGANKSDLSGGIAMYFPQTGNKVNIYALHTTSTYLPTNNSFPTNELTHTVATDQQTTASGTGYQGSDLVYAKLTEVERKSTATNLSFNHLLSKIEVVLKEGVGESDFLTSEKINKVEILSTLPDAKFTLTKESAAYGKNADKTDGIAITAGGTATPITIDKDVTDGSEELNEAIIVPQALDGSTTPVPFIQITLNSGGVFTYNLQTTTTFESGKKYKYVITANQTGLTVTSSISPWGSGTGDDNGKAEM